MNFITSEAGAVTVDWTVLTGTVAVLGLASTLVVSAGLEALSSDIALSLDMEIMNAFESILYNEDFAGAFNGWANGATDDSEPWYGAILGPFGGTDGEQTVRNVFDIPGNAEVARVSFDLHAIDSWDGEDFIVFIDDEPVTSLSFRYSVDGVVDQWVSSNPNISISVDPIAPRGNQGYDADWPDQSFSVSIDVQDPNQQISIGYGSTLNQSVQDESWAVDNVEVRGIMSAP